MADIVGKWHKIVPHLKKVLGPISTFENREEDCTLPKGGEWSLRYTIEKTHDESTLNEEQTTMNKLTEAELSKLINIVAGVNLVTCPHCWAISQHALWLDWNMELGCATCNQEYPIRERPDLFY